MQKEAISFLLLLDFSSTRDNSFQF